MTTFSYLTLSVICTKYLRGLCLLNLQVISLRTWRECPAPLSDPCSKNSSARTDRTMARAPRILQPTQIPDPLSRPAGAVAGPLSERLPRATFSRCAERETKKKNRVSEKRLAARYIFYSQGPHEKKKGTQKPHHNGRW